MGRISDAIIAGVKEGSHSALVKIALRIFVFLNLGIACGLTKHFFPEMVPGGLALAALSGSVLGAIEVEIIGRFLGYPNLVYDFTLRASRMIMIGVAIALLFAAGLTLFELNDQRQADQIHRQVLDFEQQEQQQIQSIKKQFPNGFEDMNKVLLDAKAKVDAAQEKLNKRP